MCDIAALYEEEQPRVFSYLIKRCHNWHVAEDLTSATIEKALSLLPHPNPHALLLSIARNVLMNHWQRENKRRTWSFADTFTAYDEDRYAVLASDDVIEHVIDACDTAMAAALVRATLAQCSDQELQIIHLRYIQRLPAQDVAARLGLTKLHYNKRHNGLLHRLAQRLNPAPDRPHATCLLCDGEIYGRGVCHYHYQHMREGKRIPLLAPKAVQYKQMECRECGGKHYSRGLCRPHYEHMRTRERMENRRVAGQLL
jgi:RNA polymerase sigma factor (sigma-70 family)